MPNEGFKGARVQIEQLTIATGPTGAPVLRCSIQFMAEDGTVHAVAQHSFLLDPETATDAITTTATELLRLLTNKIEALHFDRPEHSSTSSFDGILESFGATPKTPDEPGTQG